MSFGEKAKKLGFVQARTTAVPAGQGGAKLRDSLGLLSKADEMSSGSSRAASSVEPTRSQNSTVSCRRSASGRTGGPAAVVGSRFGGHGRALNRVISCRGFAAGACTSQPCDRVEQPAPMADQGNAEILEVVGGQIGQEIDVDLVVAERLLIALEPQARSQSAMSMTQPSL